MWWGRVPRGSSNVTRDLHLVVAPFFSTVVLNNVDTMQRAQALEQTSGAGMGGAREMSPQVLPKSFSVGMLVETDLEAVLSVLRCARNARIPKVLPMAPHTAMSMAPYHRE